MIDLRYSIIVSFHSFCPTPEFSPPELVVVYIVVYVFRCFMLPVFV